MAVPIPGLNDKERAKQAFCAVADFMDESKLRYTRDDENNLLFVTVTGADFPVTLMISVDPDKQRVEVYSQLPFTVKPEKLDDMAMTIAAINSRIAYGKFCLYPEKNLCTYENSEYITELEGFSPAYGKAIVASAYSIVEEYNDKLYRVNKGILPFARFMKEVIHAPKKK